MARSRSYDDLSDNRVSRRGSSSSKILLAVILLSILICAIAVLVWVKLLETQELTGAESNALPAVSDNAADKVVVPPTAEPEPVAEASTVASKTGDSSVDLSIDSAISALSAASALETDYITASDYGLSDVPEDSVVMEESVEMKKPAIAQNLSISQQSSFSRDIVRYQQYTIKEGDSLLSIADSFGLSVQTLVAVNQIKSTMDLWIGSTLQVPDRDGTLYVVNEGDTLVSIASQLGLAISPKTLGDVNGIMENDLTPGQ